MELEYRWVLIEIKTNPSPMMLASHPRIVKKTSFHPQSQIYIATTVVGFSFSVRLKPFKSLLQNLGHVNFPKTQSPSLCVPNSKPFLAVDDNCL
ncbi:hypothetical protein L6452_03462 [Arctium lappa]|uniref:Uncharacterized protein n=1 Tax=Arctium lappa TaxID=4217 RepID=A0ACB9FN62_ARCLA|nr:hypothetical protein L6452_03462 [Arctium lappa]